MTGFLIFVPVVYALCVMCAEDPLTQRIGEDLAEYIWGTDEEEE